MIEVDCANVKEEPVGSWNFVCIVFIGDVYGRMNTQLYAKLMHGA